MSVGLAVGYVSTLLMVYYLFVKWYYNRAAMLSSHMQKEHWFPTPHTAKEAYLNYYDSIDSDTFNAEQVKQLKTLLMRRTMTNVERVYALREDRATLALLMANGSIGDGLWHEFLEAETEIDHEITMCVQEAEAIQQGWGKVIFPQAAQLINREKEKMIAEQLKKLSQRKQDEEILESSLEAQKLYREQLERELIEEEERKKKPHSDSKQFTKQKSKSKKA